jgi:outer membrane protein
MIIIRFILLSLLMLFLFISPSIALDLNDAVLIALQNNPQIASAQAGIESAKAGIWEANSGFLPSVSFSRSRTINDEEVIVNLGAPEMGLGSVVMTPKEINATGIEITQPIFNGGVILTGRSMAVLGKEIKMADYKNTLQVVAHSAMKAYLDLWEVQELAIVTKETQKSLKEHYRITQKLFEVGIVPKSDLLRMEAAIAEIDQGVIATEDGVRLSIAALNLALGRDQDIPVDIVEPEKITAPLYTIDESLRKAFDNRADFQSLLLAGKITQKQVLMESASLFPSINFAANYSLTAEPIGFSSDKDTWSFTFVASYKLPIGLGNVARVQNAKTQSLSMAKQIELAKMGTELEIRAAYIALEQSQAAIEPALKGQESARENLRLVEASYNEGVASQVEYLDARLAATEADSRVIQNKIKIYKAVIDLQKAMGIIQIPSQFLTKS